MVSPKPRLTVIGSGWAGFYISDHIDLNAYEVTVISPRRTSAFTPLLASAAVGLFNFYLAEESVRSKSRSALKFIKANVLDIDFDNKTCRCAPAFDDDEELVKSEFDVDHDYLVLAPGCEPNTFNTKGVSEHAIFVKNVSDAMKIRKTLFDLLEKASLPAVSEDRARSLLHIAIVGGGPTGIELTAELDDLCKNELADLYPDVVKYMSISIYDVAPHILSAYDEKLHDDATNQLLKRKIDVAPNTIIESVDKDNVHIKGRGPVGYGMLIWATGNKNVPLLEKLAVELPEKGLKRVITDDKLRVFRRGTDFNQIYDGVFALGDAADIKGGSLPTTAEVACQKAKYLVQNFEKMKRGEDAFKDRFEYTQKRLVSYIGQRDGVIAGKGHDDEGWTGRSAWLAWRSGSIAWNRNWRSRFAILLTWMLNALFGKEVAKI
jgi:NADH:ubiquinone reductase (non-electrogenic)